MSAITDNLNGLARVAGPTGAARPCKLGAILDRLDPTDRDAVTDAIRTPVSEGGASDENVTAAVTSGGHPVSVACTRRHRLHLCGCPTERNEPHQ